MTPAPWTLLARDEDDRWVPASAIRGKAEVLMTGDRDLLGVPDQVLIRIVGLWAFWQMLRKT